MVMVQNLDPMPTGEKLSVKVALLFAATEVGKAPSENSPAFTPLNAMSEMESDCNNP